MDMDLGSRDSPDNSNVSTEDVQSESMSDCSVLPNYSDVEEDSSATPEGSCTELSDKEVAEVKDDPPCELCGQAPCDWQTFCEDICEVYDELKDSGVPDNQVRFWAYRENTRLPVGWQPRWTSIVLLVKLQAQSLRNKEIKHGRSDLCHYDINVKYCTALKLMGVGGEHAAIMAAYLDLPDAIKWPRQFSVLEQHLFPTFERMKAESQATAAEKEVEETIIDQAIVVQQTYLELDAPIHRVEASFDMGWQVRSSGGKYGSSTGHALLIGVWTKKVLDSIIFNKKCRVCTKHEKRTGSMEHVRKHTCVENFEGLSKSMEAAALVTML